VSMCFGGACAGRFVASMVPAAVSLRSLKRLRSVWKNAKPTEIRGEATPSKETRRQKKITTSCFGYKQLADGCLVATALAYRFEIIVPHSVRLSICKIEICAVKDLQALPTLLSPIHSHKRRPFFSLMPTPVSKFLYGQRPFRLVLRKLNFPAFEFRRQSMFQQFSTIGAQHAG